MAKALILSFTPIQDKDGNILYESNAFQINGYTGIHLDMEGTGSSVTVLRSITGINYVSYFHDYCGEIFDWIIPQPGIGQAYKVRVNKMPLWGIAHGDVEDMGIITPDDDIENAFCGSDGQYFMGKDGNFFLGKTK